MRFSCESCQAKYSIPDERVEGKIVRLKCQKCGAEIVVKGSPKPSQPDVKTTTDQEPKPRPTQPPEPPPAKTGKIAPITRIEDRPSVRLDESAFGSGDEDEEPRESTRIASLTELERMRAEAATDLQKPKQEKKKTPAPPPPPAIVAKAEWLVLIGGAQQGPFTEDDIRMKLVSGELHSRSYMWKEGMGEWQRLQNIPEFSDIAITKLAEPKTPVQSADFDSVFGKAGEPKKREPPPLNQTIELDPEPSGPHSLSEELSDSGVVDHRVDGPQTGETPLVETFNSEGPQPPRESTRQFMAAAGMNAQKKKQRIVLAVSVSVVLLLLVVLVLDVLGVITLPGFSSDEVTKPAAPQSASQPASLAVTDSLSDDEKTRLRDGLLGKKNDPKQDQEAAPTEHQARKEKKSAAPEKTEGAEQQLLADVYGDSTKSAVRVEAPTLKTAEQDLPAGINAEVIAKVVESNQRAVKSCLDRELKHGGTLKGRLEVEFNIAPSGAVTNAGIKTAKFKGTEFGDCVVGAVKAWKFPRFSGDPVPVEYPFILSSSM